MSEEKLQTHNVYINIADALVDMWDCQIGKGLAYRQHRLQHMYAPALHAHYLKND